MDLGPLTEILQTADELRRDALDRFGPLAPMVTSAGQGIAAVYALAVLAFGRSLWAPPAELSAFPVRIGSLIAFVCIVGLFVWSVNGGTPLTFLMIGFVCIIVGAFAALLYYRNWRRLCFKCPGDPTVRVKGLELTEISRNVLAGNLNQVPENRRPVGQLPNNELDYYCNAGEQRDQIIWTEESRERAEMRLIRGYLFFMVPILVGIAAAATALAQPDIKVENKVISLPGDVLFEFDKSDIRPGAVVTLEQAVKIMQKRKVTAARVDGYTDNRGTAAHNKTLSERRAKAVRDWLVGQGGLISVRFTVEGHGASSFVASNDTPGDRAKNRRVAIVIEK